MTIGSTVRLFFLALLVGAATFNLFYSFLAGCLLFGVVYGVALWSGAHDPQMLQIVLRAVTAKSIEAERSALFREGQA